MTTRTSMLRTDSELVEVVKNGSHERYGELVRRHKSLVTTYCFNKVKQRETAEDLAQDTFVRGFEALKNLKKTSAFSGWLLSIAHNVCIDYLRSKQRTVPLEVFGDHDSPGEIIIEDTKECGGMERMVHEEMYVHILDAINDLSEEYRETLMLRYVNELSCDQIAEMLNISLGTVTSRLSRARRLLSKPLGKFIDPEK